MKKGSKKNNVKGSEHVRNLNKKVIPVLSDDEKLELHKLRHVDHIKVELSSKELER